MSTAPLHYIAQGEGPTAVLLHPVGLDLTCWDRVAANLTRSFKVIRLDLPGHGQSPAATSRMTLSNYGTSVCDLLDRLGEKRVSFVGLSFGGMITQTLGIEHPDLCEALVISGCPCTFPPAARIAVEERGQLASREGMTAVIESTMARWFTPAFLEAGKAEPVRARLLADDPEGWRTAWKAISQLDTIKDLGRVRAKTLCIAGELDLGAPVESVKQIATSIPDAKFVVLNGAPHMMNIECADLFADATVAFLQEVSVKT